ncbi:C-reactive protein-like [Pelmatolapia mariae]|uniref:C-reactive protein-like n=1 Tax=Pelmatolapia mariae TaxID=158779 RepID=UPI002FE56952
MALLLLLVMLTSCAAAPQNLARKMFTFPEETDTAHVKLLTKKQDLSAVTVCLRSFTDLRRIHLIFSLATASAFNDFLLMKQAEGNLLYLWEHDSFVGGFDKVQSFLGMMSDVHMWDYVFFPCEIQNYLNELTFTPVNVLNWNALDFQITVRVLIEDKQTC